MRRLALALVLLGTPALADDDDTEIAHLQPTRVGAVLDGGTAKVTARFEIRLTSNHHHGADVRIDVPRRAAVTGAVATADGAAHRLALVPVAEANRELDALHAPGRPGTPPWAVVISWADDLYAKGPYIGVYAPHAGKLLLDVELEAPTCVYRDNRYLAVPESWSREEGDAKLTEVCGGLEGGEHWLRFAAPLSKLPSGEARVVTQADRLHVASADFARVELDLARELADIPRDLRTVLVVDGSRSMSFDEREAERALIASYLERAPHTAVQMISYARTARALLPGWTSTDTAGTRIAHELAALVPSNGSNIDAGLREAASWLARSPGTHRVIVFTDDLVADRVIQNVASFAGLLPRNTLVHVVALSTGELERDDDDKLSPLAAATGGMLVRGGKLDTGVADATPLVRPVALDHVVIRAVDWSDLELDGPKCSERMLAGTSCSWWGKGLGASGAVVVDGQLWGRKIHRVLMPNLARSRTVARELSRAGSFEDDPKLKEQIQRAAAAVNSVWSLIATWGGHGSYPDDFGFGDGFTGACGCDGRSDDMGSTFGLGGPKLDLTSQLAPAVASCHPGNAHLDVDVEITRQEIVDVAVQGGTPSLRACVTEAVWRIELAIHDPPDHDTIRASF
jgi:hypothetical protein